jgi:hypothetical protein
MVWSAFAAEMKYFERREREFMVNVRVGDLDGLLARLRDRGARVLDRREGCSPRRKSGEAVEGEEDDAEVVAEVSEGGGPDAAGAFA